MKKILSVFLPWLFYIQVGSAQESVHKDSLNSLSLAGKTGTISSPAEHKPTGAVYGVDLEYRVNMIRDSAGWVRVLHVKYIGIDASYLTMKDVSLIGVPDSKGMLGNSYGLMTRLGMSICQIGSTDIVFRPGIGFEYATETFQTNRNPIVGSHLNFALQAGIVVETALSASTKLTLSADITHVSNAYMRSPNAGENIAAVSIGIIENINQKGPAKNEDRFGAGGRSSVEFNIGVGQRDFTRTGYFNNNPTGQKYVSYDQQKAEGTSNLNNVAASLTYDYQVSSVFSLKIGTDAVYYTQTFSPDNFFKTYQGPITSYTPLTVGISTGIGMTLGRLVFVADYGWYVHSNFLDRNTKSYWTFGPKYYLTNWMALFTKVSFAGNESSYANAGISFSIK